MLGNLGNGLTRIGMHDMGQEFARLETQFGEFKDRQCIFEWDKLCHPKMCKSLFTGTCPKLLCCQKRQACPLGVKMAIFHVPF